MSGVPRVRSMNIAQAENKEPKKAAKKQENLAQETEKKCGKVGVRAKGVVLRQKSMNASCSSDASSSDSSHSRASSSSSSWSRSNSKMVAARRNGVMLVVGSKNISADSGNKLIGGGGGNGGVVDVVSVGVGGDCLESKTRCSWVTPNCDPCYATFHDEEWGVPVHDDKKLFELLSLSGALAELTWPVILNRRHIFREVFLDFDPIAVSKFSERKIATPGSPACSLLSELKLRSIIENARQMCKVIEEFGSFDKYIWNFVNHKPIVGQFRYPRQVPVKTPKAEVISKDLVRRGFRSVGPTVIYSFMQAAGLTNDHIISCFRFQEYMTGAEVRDKDEVFKANAERKEPEDAIDVGLSKAVNDWSSSN